MCVTHTPELCFSLFQNPSTFLNHLLTHSLNYLLSYPKERAARDFHLIN